MNDPNERIPKKEKKVSRFTDSATKVISTYTINNVNNVDIYAGHTIQNFVPRWGQHLLPGKYWPRKKRKWKEENRGVLGKELEVTATAYEATLLYLNLIKTVVSKNKKAHHLQKKNIDKIIVKFKKINGSTSVNPPQI